MKERSLPQAAAGTFLVTTLDFAPTLLDAARLPPLTGIDCSFLPAVEGEKIALYKLKAEYEQKADARNKQD